MLIYFWVVLVISPAGFLEDLLGCSAICIINDSYHIVNILKCMCSQNKVIHSFIYISKSIDFIEIKSLSTVVDNIKECVAVELKLNKGKRNHRMYI